MPSQPLAKSTQTKGSKSAEPKSSDNSASELCFCDVVSCIAASRSSKPSTCSCLHNCASSCALLRQRRFKSCFHLWTARQLMAEPEEWAMNFHLMSNSEPIMQTSSYIVRWIELFLDILLHAMILVAKFARRRGFRFITWHTRKTIRPLFKSSWCCLDTLMPA